MGLRRHNHILRCAATGSRGAIGIALDLHVGAARQRLHRCLDQLRVRGCESLVAAGQAGCAQIDGGVVRTRLHRHPRHIAGFDAGSITRPSVQCTKPIDVIRLRGFNAFASHRRHDCGVCLLVTQAKGMAQLMNGHTRKILRLSDEFYTTGTRPILISGMHIEYFGAVEYDIRINDLIWYR